MKIDKLLSYNSINSTDYLTGEIIDEGRDRYFVGYHVFPETNWRGECRYPHRIKIRNGAIRLTSSSNTTTFLLPGARSKFYKVANYRQAMNGWIGRCWIDKTEKVHHKGRDVIVYHFEGKIVGVWYIDDNCGSYNKDFVGTYEEYFHKDPFCRWNFFLI